MNSFLLAVLLGLFFGLGVFVGSAMSREQATSGAAYDALCEPVTEPTPRVWQEADDIVNGLWK